MTQQTIEDVTLLADFKVYHQVGSGTFSEVFKAKHRASGLKVALKIINVK
jgi:serine/threonine protein kinase